MMEPIYTIEPTLEAAFAHVDEFADLALDTETVGKYGKIKLLQLYQRHCVPSLGG